MGETVDDAAGEAFDKTAKLLGLGYPGGPALARLAQQGDARRFKLPRPMLHSGDLNFSFSGLKTAVLTVIKREPLNEQSRADLAAAIESAIVEVLIAKSLAALEQSGMHQLVVAGGVGANRKLRDKLTQQAARKGIRVFYPELEFCTDNGAMIAFAGAMRLQQAGTSIKVSGLKDFSVKPRWDLELPEAVALGNL
jgi:N6-L-threonylcarbamoyladenine synthase